MHVMVSKYCSLELLIFLLAARNALSEEKTVQGNCLNHKAHFMQTQLTFFLYLLS